VQDKPIAISITPPNVGLSAHDVLSIGFRAPTPPRPPFSDIPEPSLAKNKRIVELEGPYPLAFFETSHRPQNGPSVGQTMCDDTTIANCCAACFGICCLACCESILVSLNFKKPGSRPGSTQRGCCGNWGESTEDDEFEEAARKERLAKSSKKPKNLNQDGGKEEKIVEGNEEEGGGDKAVSDQPLASPEMTAPPTDIATKPEVEP